MENSIYLHIGLTVNGNIYTEIKFPTPVNINIIEKYITTNVNPIIKEINSHLQLHNRISLLENIFTISLDSFITYQNMHDKQRFINADNKNSYFYEIKEISNAIIENLNNNNKFYKIESNINLLSKWFSY